MFVCKLIIANIPPNYKGLAGSPDKICVMTGGFMLKKIISVRVDDLWTVWAKRLGEQADRTPSDFIRDLIFLMVFDDELGQALCQRLKSEQISYNK